MKKYDVVILGAGPAGLTSAIYSARYGMKTLVITKDVGGTANLAEKIENYPGYEGSGFELMQKFYRQAKSFGAEFLNDDVLSIKRLKNEIKIITISKNTVNANSLIIALGTQRMKLNVNGEDKFLGRGVSYCVTCDGHFFRNKTVAVVGGGDSACSASEVLLGIAKRVYMIYRGDKLKCERIMEKRLKKNKKFDVLFNAVPLEIKGGESVSSLVFKKNKREEEIKVEGIFIEIGALPVSDIARLLNIKMNDRGYLIVNSDMETNVQGIFAAGDVVESKLKQVVIAASQGAVAARSAYEYLKRKN